MNDWNPEKYLQFRDERTQPSIDLVNRIELENPKTIIDIGCGPGNSTNVLINRWPEARIIGLDNSPSMIAKARKDYPNQEWILADAANFETKIKFDLIFSNATIQWIPDHKRLIKKFYDLLTDNGKAAVQIPLFMDMAIGKIIDAISRKNHWRSKTENVFDLFTIHDHSFYYDQLTRLFSKVEMWETDYMNVLDSQRAILDMIRSTGLKPYLERLDSDSEKGDFENEVLEGIIKSYPLQQNGKVILPFKRLFFVAYK